MTDTLPDDLAVRAALERIGAPMPASVEWLAEDGVLEIVWASNDPLGIRGYADRWQTSERLEELGASVDDTDEDTMWIRPDELFAAAERAR